MNRREILAAAVAAAGLASVGAPALAAAPRVHVMKSPYCGCCGGWVDHMRAEGFEVEVVDVSPEALEGAKAAAGIGPETASCHTAHVEGYVVEGHVPAADVRRLLDEKPDAIGLAAPGMPLGSPGMDGPGMGAEPYEVLLLKRGGGQEVFARH